MLLLGECRTLCSEPEHVMLSNVVWFYQRAHLWSLNKPLASPVHLPDSSCVLLSGCVHSYSTDKQAFYVYSFTYIDTTVVWCFHDAAIELQPWPGARRIPATLCLSYEQPSLSMQPLLTVAVSVGHLS